MKLVYGADEAVAIWVSSQIPGIADFHTRRDAEGNRLFHSIGVSDGDKLVAGVVYHNYYPEARAIEISMAAITPIWAKKEIIAGLLHYPFVTLDCQRITTLTPANNKRALRFNEHIGFKREGLVRRGYGHDDMVVNGLLIEEAQHWLEHYVKPETN